MGRSTYKAYGQGMTESEALQNALERDRVENGHQDGYSGTIGSRTTTQSECIKQPKPAKKCKVERLKNKPKFKKVFAIRPCSSNYGNHFDSRPTKREAIERAKEMALKYGMQFIVSVEMQPESNSQLAIVTPAKSEMGTWKFWGEARS